MTDARASLASLRSVIRLVAQARELPTSLELTKAVASLGEAQGPALPPQEAFLEEVRRNLTAAAEGPGGVAAAAKRDLRNAPWLLWTEKDALADLPGLLDAIFNVAKWSGSVRRNLVEVWISACDSTRPGIEACGLRLDRLVRQSEDARLDFWRRAQARFDFFDIRRGPSYVAAEIVHKSELVGDILQGAGIDEPLRAGSGYARLVQSQVLAELPAALASRCGETVFERIQSFLAPDERLRFDEPKELGRLATALLAPWRRASRSTPGDSARKKVQDFLLRHLGDPRTRGDRWMHADPEAVGVMRGWLARASLEAFFDVVADHADDNFPYRRAFWTACLQKAQQAGKFVDVWLALGARVRAQADGIRELHGNFARLRGSAGDQSVFLMKIESTVFCEWSHSGSLRAWPEDWKNAPKVGLTKYDRENMMGSCLPFPRNARYSLSGSAAEGTGLRHIKGSQGYWQASAAELIERRCGIRLDYNDWMSR